MNTLHGWMYPPLLSAKRRRKTEPEMWTEPIIAPERKPNCDSDLVCKVASLCIAMEHLVVYEGMEENPDHNPTAEGELKLASVIII